MAKEIRALTGIRGLAACYVVIYHMHVIHGAADTSGIWNVFLSNGYLAVDLFFVLSGFVMALSYGRYAEQGWTLKNYGIFLLRRFARIYPLYIFMLAVIILPIALGLSKAFVLNTAAIAENILLIQSWGLSGSINFSSWSISTEFAAYVLFPGLTLLTLTGHRAIALITAIAALIVIYLLQFTPTPPLVDARDGQLDIFWMPSLLPLARCISEFTLGLIAFRLSRNETVRKLSARRDTAFLVTFALLASLFIIRADVETILLLPPFLLVLASGSNAVVRAIGNPAIFFLGEISYSLYLVHEPFIRIRRIGFNLLAPHIGDGAATFVALVTFYVTIFLCSWLTYRYIEKPCRTLIRRWEPAASDPSAFQNA